MIFSYVGLWAKLAYLHFIYSLCALHYYECNQLVAILSSRFILSKVKSVFILNISSASFYQYQYFFDLVTVIFFYLITC